MDYMQRVPTMRAFFLCRFKTRLQANDTRTVSANGGHFRHDRIVAFRSVRTFIPKHDGAYSAHSLFAHTMQ